MTILRIKKVQYHELVKAEINDEFMVKLFR